MSIDRAPARGRRASLLVGPWPPVLAWGASLVLAGLGAGAIVASGTTPLARGLGVGAITIGLGGLVWGALTIRSGRPLAPRLLTAASLGALLISVFLLLAAPTRISVLGVAVVVVLCGSLGMIGAAAARRRPDAGASSVWALLLAAAVIAVLVTPALGAVQEGVLLRVDGTLPTISHH